MAGALTRRAPGALARPDAAPDAGAAVSLASMTFGAKAFTLADVRLGSIRHQTVGLVVAEPRPYRSPVGLVQRATAVRAARESLVVTSLERPLTLREGAARPVGAWAPTHEVRYAGRGAATRGTVAAGVGAATASGPDVEAVSGFAEAEAALPPAVRAGVIRAVPTPATTLGAITRWTTGAWVEDEIIALRLDAPRAVIVRATRRARGGPPAPSTPWDTIQITWHDLAARVAALPPRRESPLEILRGA